MSELPGGSIASRSDSARVAILVGLGGAVGALARWGIDLLAEHLGLMRPAATLTVNVLGCLLMGVLVAAVLTHPRAHPHLRPFLGAGVLGGFTTFSAFAAELVHFLRDDRLAAAVVYLALSLLGSLAAVWLGVRLGSRVPWRSP